jgi:hypothetical protein
MATHTELWPIDKLIPFARNPRSGSREFGLSKPILEPEPERRSE